MNYEKVMSEHNRYIKLEQANAKYTPKHSTKVKIKIKNHKRR